MGEQHANAQDFVADRAGFTTDPVTNLRTGGRFIAEIDGSPDAVLVTTEIGEDYRNVVMFHVNSDEEAAGIRAQDKVSFKLYGKTSVAQIIKRRDSAANAQNDFWAFELTDKDS